MNNEDRYEATSTEDFLRELMEDAHDGAAFTQAYIKANIISSAMQGAYFARKNAGLTQADIARSLHTKQPGIARLEADVGGTLAFRRYVDLAFACGKAP